MAMRASERDHDYHRAMHEVIERLERLITLVVLLFLGIATTRGLLNDLTWSSVLVGVALIFVIRPLVRRIVTPDRPQGAGALLSDGTAAGGTCCT